MDQPGLDQLQPQHPAGQLHPDLVLAGNDEINDSDDDDFLPSAGGVLSAFIRC